MEGNHSVCGASMNINPNFCIFNRTQSLCLIYDPIFHSTQVSDHTKDYQLRSKPQTCKIAALGFCRTPICFLSPIRHHFWRSNLRAPECIRHLLFLHINWAINCYWEKIPWWILIRRERTRTYFSLDVQSAEVEEVTSSQSSAAGEKPKTNAGLQLLQAQSSARSCFACCWGKGTAFVMHREEEISRVPKNKQILIHSSLRKWNKCFGNK